MEEKLTYQLGQIVYLGNRKERELEGEVVAIMIKPTHVEYEIMWWKEQERKTIWLNENEFSVKKGTKKGKLGFVTGIGSLPDET